MTIVTNRHPVDELADLRDQISRMEGRADYLRRMILAGDCSVVGDEHHAVVREAVRQVVDAKALRVALGDKAEAFMKPVASRQVFIRKGAPKPAAPEFDDGEF